jgi:hypothetical protein
LIALTEGLDYLACLLREKNFAKIAAGYGRETGISVISVLPYERISN